MTLGEKIKFLREQKDLSQGKLAKEINSAASVVWKYENDKSIPSADVLKRLAEVFNVSADFLLFDEDEGQKSKVTDKKLMKQIQEIDKMDEKTKEHVRFFLEATINTHKMKHTIK